MMINDNRPELSPRFFQVDLAPPIGKFLYRSEGECCSIVLIVVLL